MIKYFKEEILVVLITLAVITIAFSPFVYEMVSVRKSLPEIRYPLFESDFAPDMRVYLSRMQQGYEGKWLVEEKYTSEPHQPSILHLSYLFMGKATGLLGIAPPQALPIWRLVCGAFMLLSGYFFILTFLKDSRLRLAALLLFVMVGNIPFPDKNGISLLGHNFSFFLGWYTFFDPVKRIVFLPHYNLAAGFTALTMAFLYQGMEEFKKSKFLKAGVLAFFTGLILPPALLVVIATAGLLFVARIITLLKKRSVKQLAIISWPFWLLVGLSLLLIKFSLSYFPWNVQSLSDAAKRGSLLFDYKGVLFGLGPTGILGLVGAVYVFFARRKTGFLSALWLLGVVLLIAIFSVFPLFHPYRFIQVDLHLPLAITTVVLLNGIAGKVKALKNRFFLSLIAFLLLPSIVVWSASLKAQKMFVEAKIAAALPLIPRLPYVVYPVRTVMEAVFWLRDQTDHKEIVLAAETLGSMIPAYSGNTVFLGHGNQTVYFAEKLNQAKDFYQGSMNPGQMEEFLAKNGIKYVFYGPEEAEWGSFNQSSSEILRMVYSNKDTAIYRVVLR